MKKLASGIVSLAFSSLLPASIVSAGEIILGQIASTSSVSARGLSTSLNLGYRVYFDKLNRQGGVNGNTVKVVLKDDGVRVDDMVKITRDFIADKSVIGLVGYLNTAGMAEIGKQNLLPQGGTALVAPMQGDKRIVSAPNFFPFRSGYQDEINALVREAHQTQKQRVFIVYQSTTLGPPNAAFAEQEAKRLGLTLVGKAAYDTTPPDKFAEGVHAIVDEVVRAKPDAVFLVASGAPTFVVVAALRDSPAEPHVIYGISTLNIADIPPTVPIAKVRGVIVAQAIPYPFSGVIPIVREYQKAMKEFAPEKPLDYLSLEGFIGAKICHEALKRAGKKPTRKSFLNALHTLGEVDLGGVSVNYNAGVRQGWGGVDLTIFDGNGRLQR
jgi:ABC-type branched-subunit amino acid transport system substrate-binding protein